MDIRFEDRKLGETCNSDAKMLKHFGKERARKLQQRLVELRAAETLKQISHLPPLRCHELQGDRQGQFAVDLKQPFRLVFVPDHDPVPVNLVYSPRPVLPACG
jgi:proteic killer suppression protein